MAETGQTLPNAATLLEFERRELRNYAITKVSDNWVKAQWKSLQSVTTAREWREQVLSTDNRLARFIGSSGIRRFMGMDQNNIDLLDIIDSGNILLVNLGSSGFLDREAARVFASLFLNEFFDVAMLRANRAESSGQAPQHYILYLDEFQEYITDDIAAMLDQVRKGGLHIVLAHQHLGHFADNPKLKKSVFTNARLRAVFGGLDYEDACVVGNEMFLPDLNTRQLKKAYYHTIHVYEAQTRTIRSHSSSHGSSLSTSTSSGSGSSFGSSSGSGIGDSAGQANMMPMTGAGLGSEGWFTESAGLSSFSSDSSSQSSSDFASESEGHSETDSESFGETVVPVWVPIPTQELTTESEWTREEKLSKVAQLLKEQMQQHCFIKLDTEKTQPLLVPFVKDYGLSEKALLEYQQEVYKAQGALPAADVDRLLKESHEKFLSAAAQTINIDPGEAEEPTAPKPEVSVPATGKSAVQPKSIWNRSDTAANPTPTGPPSTSGLQSSPRKRGPKPDVENHAKVVNIVSSYGEHWTLDDNLREVCDTLDQQNVPIPKTWPVRLDGRSRSWSRAFENYPHLVVKAIKDRCKMAQVQATGTEPKLS